MPTFRHGDLELHYVERGEPGAPPVVLLHGLLFSSRMFERLLTHVRGHRMVLLDLHGHGRSSKPDDPARYTWQGLAGDVVAVLDHLGAERAVVGGLSLGANVTLAAAHLHPDRVRAMILEMPVLERGHAVGRRLFGAMAAGLSAGAPVLGPLTAAVGRLPLPRRGVPDLLALRDVASAPPRSAAALLRGLLGDEAVPADPASLAALTMPALVVGHHRDPLHDLADARDLAEHLPDARLVEASSILEHRVRPDRLARHVQTFLDGLTAS